MDFAMYSNPYSHPSFVPSRRTATLPINPSATPQRAISPPPSSAPPVAQPHPSSSSAKMRALEPRRMMAQESISTMSHRNPDLEQEIARLTALCEEHERKIRATRNSIEHRLFSEIPSMLTRLNDLDDAADVVTAQLYSSIQSAHPALQSKLSAITSARQQDVETMRARTTPWKSFFEANEGAEGAKVKGAGRIARIAVATGDGANTLSTIERWAEEVEMYLTSEIIRLKTTLSTRSRRRDIIVNAIICIGIGLPILLVLLAIGSRFMGG